MDSVKCPRRGWLYSFGFVEVRVSIGVILNRAMNLRAYKSREFPKELTLLMKDSGQHDLRCNVACSYRLTVYIDKGSTHVGGVVDTAFITR